MKRLVTVLFLALVYSCIPHKNTVYLQDNGEGSNEAIPYDLSEVQKPYRIQIDDILNIRIKVLDQDNVQIFNPIGEQNLDANAAEKAYFDGFTVDLQGRIRVPTIGYMDVLGLTAKEIEDLIKDRLLEEQFKETANIFISVKLAGLRYTVNGEVGRPGTVTLFKERVNILEAVANVGEIKLTGNKKNVALIRQYPNGQKIHRLDLTDINVMKSAYYYIQPNDMIYVEPLPVKSIGTGGTLTSTITTAVGIMALITSIVLISRG